MRITCPHCRNAVNIVPEASATVSTTCPSCGSQFPPVDSTFQLGEGTGLRPQEKLGQFELLQIIGQGQFGTVWKARDLRIERTVALKVPRVEDVSDATRMMFLREARAAAAVRHPNIVTVLEVDEDQGRIYIASELIDGLNLREKLQLGRMTFRATCSLLMGVAEGLQAAHEAGITHRDLKPSNILIDHSGRPFISDFGLAKYNTTEITMTASGIVLGTPAYMSPEQARGDNRTTDRRSDVYSLGVILYEMLTGQRPFGGDSNLLLRQIQSEDPRGPRSIDRTVPRELETICLKAIEKQPDLRYQTAAAFAEDLKRFLNGEPLQAKSANVLQRAWKKARRNPQLTAAVSVAVLSLAVTTILASTYPARRSFDFGATSPAVNASLVPLAWPGHSQGDFYKPSDDKGPVAINSTAVFSCFQTDTPPGDEFVMSIDAERQHLVSAAGIAVGIHQTSIQPVEYRCLVFFVDGRADEGTWLTVEESDIRRNSFGSPGLLGRSRVARLQIDDQAHAQIQLSVTVRGHRIHAVHVNGSPLADIAKLSNVHIPDSAPCGIVAMGHVVFQSIQCKGS